MASKKQRAAARKNIKKAADAAKRKQTLSTCQKKPDRARKTGRESQKIAAVTKDGPFLKYVAREILRV